MKLKKKLGHKLILKRKFKRIFIFKIDFIFINKIDIQISNLIIERVHLILFNLDDLNLLSKEVKHGSRAYLS